MTLKSVGSTQGVVTTPCSCTPPHPDCSASAKAHFECPHCWSEARGAFVEPGATERVDLDAIGALYDRLKAVGLLRDSVPVSSPDDTATRVLAEIAARGDRHSRWGAREQ